jgi:hypothetical protein
MDGGIHQIHGNLSGFSIPRKHIKGLVLRCFEGVEEEAI